MAPKKQNSPRLRSRFERRSAGRQPRRRILVVCEGDKTEPGYLNGLRKAHRLTTAEVMVVPAGEPSSCLTAAERRARNDDFDQVWLVMDVDTHAHLAAICDQIARKPGFNTAVSCPCFEIWLLLHVRYSARSLTARAAKDDARQSIASYDSGATFGELQPHLDAALTNAERLRQHHETADTGPDRNPSTDVDRLVHALRSLAELDGPH